MPKYEMYVDGKLYTTFEAKSDLAAKRRVSKICSESTALYMKLNGVTLCDSVGFDIAHYLPYFCQWINA